METKEKLQAAYIQYVLTHGEQPKSVYIFAKENDLAEEEFYNHFGSFESIEEMIWAGLMVSTITEVKAQEVWNQYSSREKALSLFYSFIELLKSKRSFASFSLKHSEKIIGTRKVLVGLKAEFEAFAVQIIQEGIESGELIDRPFFANKYKDALWMQFVFVLNFWLKDSSAGFEKTDEAIEKGLNVTYNLFQRSPIDELFEYGKFLAKNAGIKMPF
ncbi:TetR family transcriptional regulator C-terminal domain-containing protein [Pedobacter sp. P351]|uniref:TetR family transcriptional regulator C-terminal domain-containing protein n=1 Tax=Pedobacter superstes TaxID=3133441 RepID=UPI0030A436C0